MITYYEALRPTLDTGDVVLFSGKGGISAGIKWFTKSKWSHVGMVIRSIELDALLLWESTTLGKLKDVESGKKRQGVQVTPLSARIQTYDGEVGVRTLAVEESKRKNFLSDLVTLRNDLRQRPYEQSKIELIRSAYDGVFGANEEDLSSVFCSELVAEAYQAMNLLPSSVPSNEYTPGDFAKDKFPLTGSAILGPIQEFS